MRSPAIWLVAALLICIAVSACTQEVHLPDHPVTVHAPVGFERIAALQTQEASLRFQLPASPEGEQSVFPEISLAASVAMTIEDAAQTLSEYVRRETEHTEPPLFYGPEFIRIDGQQAIEFAISDQAVVHFVNGGAARLPLLHHDIAIAYQSRVYSCSLTVTPDDYEQYVVAFRTFCSSVRFGGAR